MIIEEQIVIKFNQDLGDLDKITFEWSDDSRNRTEIMEANWVYTIPNSYPSYSYYALIEPPTSTPGERSAIQYQNILESEYLPSVRNRGYDVRAIREGTTVKIINSSVNFLQFGPFSFTNNSGLPSTAVQMSLVNISDGISTVGYDVIQTRSPYHIFTPQTTLPLTTIFLWIYKGDMLLDVPYESTYRLQSLNLSERNNFEIADLINDFIEQKFTNGLYSSEGVWCRYQYVASEDSSLIFSQSSNFYYLYSLEGYTYFEEGINANTIRPLMMTNKEIILQKGYISNLPLFVDLVDNLILYDVNGSILSTVNISDLRSTNSNDKIYYYPIDDTIGSVVINSSDNGTPLVEEVKVTLTNDCIYTPSKITFVNKFGVLQDIWFNKKSDNIISTKEEKYQANLLNTITQTYDTSSHQSRVMNKNGNESIVLNSGFVPESNNVVFKELFLSELVWLTTYDNGNETVRPCNLKTSTLKEKTVLNDKLISYTITIDISNKIINTIR